MLHYVTAGESHGECLIAVLEGMVAGVKVATSFINAELKRRQQGYGRGKRMSMESDKAKIVSGLRKSVTTGSPISIIVANKDFCIDRLSPVTCPRPGHADLTGCLKYNFKDARNVLERSSARETAARTGIGAICKIFLSDFGVTIKSRVAMIGGITINSSDDNNFVMERIDTARKKGDTLGGIFEVVSTGVPVGLGAFSSSDKRLDGRLAGALMSIQAIKGVEFGMGFRMAEEPGSSVHDAIYYDKKKGFYRKTNNSGGIEGGISTGEPIAARCVMKPISTLMSPLDSVDLKTKKAKKAGVERSDTCAVSAAAVVAENVVAFELAEALLEKFGGDSLCETKRNFQGYIKQVKNF